ncbi:unnamed protein product [Allacma fusca]|uniref:Transmembrane protein n=1 Tax=Allacma fusca TaxID=39272 RepID=A0A8J2KB71_9HEXA|nr:unnamed protein product [Allacma fusca]
MRVRNPNSGNVSGSYLGLSVTFLLFVLGLQVTLLRAYEELPAIIQKYINFINYFQEKYMLPAELPQKKMFFLFEDFPSFFLTTMYYNAIITTFLVTSMGYFHPEHPIFPTSLAESPKNLHFVIYPLQMILTGYAISSMFALLLIFGYPMVPLLFYGLVILLEMRPGRKYYLSLDSLRTPHHFFKVYRNFQVLMKHDLPFYGAFVLPSCQFLFIICAICSTHGAIRMTGIFSLMLFSISIMCLTFLGGFFSLLGSYNEFSTGTMFLWKSHVSRRGSHRQRLRSLSPIRVNVGEFYYADKGMVLTMYAVIFENTVNLLVST